MKEDQIMKNLTLAAIAAMTLVACGGPGSQSTTQEAEAKSTAPAGETVASGAFEGQSDHVTTGSVAIKKAEDGYYVELAEDFSLDGAPDPKLGFGNPDFMAETLFSELRSKDGFQSYKLPDGFDPTAYSTIYVWCEQFSVPLGVATLN